jgi:NAD(P)-dependent dehydrogenase (short-subunit alcohol dehydrogenase family)
MRDAAEARTWFVTGCSSGIGLELCTQLLARGERVVVTARDRHKIEHFRDLHGDRALVLSLDVTRCEQAAAAVGQALEVFGRIDVLVNNAGYGYLAAVEEGEEEEIRAIFDTNFFGLAGLIREVLPAMRARAAGHIVNISSVGGLVGNVAAGYYGATKFAVEGLSEALAKEVAPLGIRVTIVEPAWILTDWSGRSLRQTQRALPAYAPTAGARRQQIVRDHGKQPGDAARVASAIIAATDAKDPPLHLVLGGLGLQALEAKLRALQVELDAWRSTSLGIDVSR